MVKVNCLSLPYFIIAKGVQIVKEDIIKFVLNDKKINKLLKEFENEFSKEYFNLNRKQRKRILAIKDDLYRNWLFSSMLIDTYITPSYLINNLVQDKFPGEYAVIPQVNIINIENDKINFKHDAIFYSSEQNPVLDDLDVLAEAASPSLLLSKEDDTYIFNGGEEVLNNITFNSPFYLSYLINLGLAMDIIKEIKGINCKCFQKTEGYLNYLNKTSEEKIKIIFNESVKISKSNMNNLPNIQKEVETDYIDLFLNNNIDDELYLKYINEAVPFANEFVQNISEYTDDKKILETIKFAQLIMGDEVGSFVMGTEIRAYLDLFFINVMGYYLGIIQPTYVGPYIMSEMVNRFFESAGEFEKIAALFNVEAGHDLTALGEKIILDKAGSINTRSYSKFNEKDFTATLKLAKSEKEQMEKEFNLYRDTYGRDKDGGIIRELINVVTGNDEEFNSYIIIQKHLEGFVQYLLETRGLKESTVITHARNMELFLGEFLRYTNDDDLKKINNNLIDNYLGDWFIRTAATSPNSIKEQIRSLKQYSSFLYQRGFITEEEMYKIKRVMEDRDKYINKYLEYIG